MLDWLTKLNKRQQDEVTLARYYTRNLNHGTSGHLTYTTNAKMADLLDAAGSPTPESSIAVSGYSLPVQGQASEWYFANEHRPTSIGDKSPHSGVDLNLLKWPRGDIELGFPTYATCAGLVVYADYAPGNYWGNLVITASKDSDGDLLYWRYAHLQKILVDVGQIIPSNKLIGTIGKGANERYYAHLHLDTWRGGMVAPGAWFHGSVIWLDPLEVWADAGQIWDWGKV